VPSLHAILECSSVWSVQTLTKRGAHTQVSVAALPPYVSLATAESILFVGKAVRVLRQGSKFGSLAEPMQELYNMDDVDARLHGLQLAEEMHPLEFEHAIESIRAKV
jgi:hypothetical protein